MKIFGAKRFFVLFAISLVLSLVIIRWHSVGNVSFCQFTPGCQFQNPKGTITERTYGYPLAYKKVTTFRPAHNDESKPDYAGYAVTSVENQSFSIPSVLMDVLFWFGVLYLVSHLFKTKQKVPAHSADN
jgi:hypothetical protein